MFKSMMIIFVVSVGFNAPDNSGDIDVILFESAEQCEFAKKQIDEITGRWGIGKDEDRKKLPVKKTIECVDIPVAMQTRDVDTIVRSMQTEIQSRTPYRHERKQTETLKVEPNQEEIFEPRKHKRWND